MNAPATASRGIAGVDVAEPGRRVRRLDADGHQPARARGLDRGGRGGAEGVGLGDDVVGGEGAHDGVGVAGLEQGGGQPDRRHRVARGRLGDHRVCAELGQLGDHRVAVGLPGDDEHPVGRQRRQPVEGGLDEACDRCPSGRAGTWATPAETAARGGCPRHRRGSRPRSARSWARQ